MVENLRGLQADVSIDRQLLIIRGLKNFDDILIDSKFSDRGVLLILLISKLTKEINYFH